MKYQRKSRIPKANCVFLQKIPHFCLVKCSIWDCFIFSKICFKAMLAFTVLCLFLFAPSARAQASAGLGIDSTTGVISGTPTTSGTSYSTITASNLGGTDSMDLVINVAPSTAPRITLPYGLFTLCAFGGTNGAGPNGGLVLGDDGNYYGTTCYGGTNGGGGTVYKVTSDGTVTTLHSFNDYDGGYPRPGLAKGSDGNYYGSTELGGIDGGDGTIFQITPIGTLTTLASFNYYFTIGSHPNGQLVQGKDGSFYGTMETGQYMQSNDGTVFKITSGGTLTTIYSFVSSWVSSWTTPAEPLAGLVLGNDGNFYGTTCLGGVNGDGTVFMITASGSLTVLYSFSGTDGANPKNGLIQGSDGSFYGMTWGGGSGGKGTVFKLTASGSLTTLHSFSGTDGQNPNASLVEGKDGNFYGTTANVQNGYGTIFQVTPDGSFATIYSFSGTDGALAFGGLIQATDGNFYGTTRDGIGNLQNGTVFEIGQGLYFTGTDHNSNYQIIATNNPTSYTAMGLPTGLSVNPATGLISGTANVTGTFSVPISAINVDGTGSATMTIVVIPSPVITSATTATATATQEYSFSYQTTATNHVTSFSATGLPDGLSMDSAGLISGYPIVTGTFNIQINAFNAVSAGTATLVLTLVPPPPEITNLLTLYTFDSPTSSAGSIYAGLVQGNDGNFYGTIDGYAGSGAIFKLTPAGNMTLLYTFSGTDGGRPYAGLVQGTDGNFYGTTWSGGINGLGVVFKITSSGSLTTLYSFSGTDGASPYAGLTQGPDGNFYGTTYSGGSNDGGTVFVITPSGNLTTLYSFSGTDGANPFAGLVQGTDGNFYGTTANGGSNGGGTVFAITPSGNLTSLCSFNGANGCYPKGGLIQGKNGEFYGTTVYGGSGGWGTVFRITQSGILTTVYSFSWGDGADPSASVFEGADGSFYGTTNEGGPYSAYYGCGGTVFQARPDGTETTLWNFSEGGGSAPTAPLIRGQNGSYYGTTSRSGSYLISTAFECAPSVVTTGTTQQFTYHILATNNPVDYAATGLPAGLILDGKTGTISGTPTITGTFSVSVTASNAGGVGSGTMSIVVLTKPVITLSGSTVVGACGSPLNFKIPASGSPSHYSATGLPPGLNINPGTGSITGTATTSGTFNATISAANMNDTDSASLTIVITSPYNAWKYQVFTPAEIGDSTISGEIASHAGDGIQNLMKYACNVNPKSRDKSGLPFVGISPSLPIGFPDINYLTLSYYRSNSALDVTFLVEVSDDLQTWHSGPGATIEEGRMDILGVTTFIIVRDSTPINSGRKRFIRLKITKP